MPIYPNPCQMLLENLARREAIQERIELTPDWKRHDLNPDWVDLSHGRETSDILSLRETFKEAQKSITVQTSAPLPLDLTFFKK